MPIHSLLHSTRPRTTGSDADVVNRLFRARESWFSGPPANVERTVPLIREEMVTALAAGMSADEAFAAALTKTEDELILVADLVLVPSPDLPGDFADQVNARLAAYFDKHQKAEGIDEVRYLTARPFGDDTRSWAIFNRATRLPVSAGSLHERTFTLVLSEAA